MGDPVPIAVQGIESTDGNTAVKIAPRIPFIVCFAPIRWKAV